MGSLNPQGFNYKLPDKNNLRVVIVKVDHGKTARIETTAGCKVIGHKLTLSQGSLYATFWIDVSGELPFDGQDVVMPDGWDYRSLMKDHA